MSVSTSTRTGAALAVGLAMSVTAAAAAFLMQRQSAPPNAHACIFNQQTGIHAATPSRDCLTGWGGCHVAQFENRPWCQDVLAYETIYGCIQNNNWLAQCGAALEALRVRGSFVPAGFGTPGYGPMVPGYAPGYAPGYVPGYTPAYAPGYVPGYTQ